MRKKMNEVAEELVKLNNDTEIIVRFTNTVSLRVAGLYAIIFTAERYGVGCKLTVDENAGVYRGPSGVGDEEPWTNHYSYRMDEVFARLARREWGFECYSPEVSSP
jgi:hypothetical protein